MPVTIISEAGVNHDGKLDKALKLCDAAKAAGADIVKFQTFTPEKCIRKGKDYALLASLALDQESFLKIAQHCRDIGIEFCSTPDHVDDLKFLVEDCGVKRIKLGSGSLLYRPLVDAAFDTGLPVLLSTGMATFQELNIELYRLVKMFGAAFNKTTVMHCVSLYPCPPHLANVSAVRTLIEQQSFIYDVGYSDHTIGSTAAVMAVALGATVIEKHFTLDKRDVGPDHFMSADPIDFRAMVCCIRKAEILLGHGRKDPGEEELAMIPRVRKDAEGFQPGL